MVKCSETHSSWLWMKLKEITSKMQRWNNVTEKYAFKWKGSVLDLKFNVIIKKMYIFLSDIETHFIILLFRSLETSVKWLLISWHIVQIPLCSIHFAPRLGPISEYQGTHLISHHNEYSHQLTQRQTPILSPRTIHCAVWPLASPADNQHHSLSVCSQTTSNKIPTHAHNSAPQRDEKKNLIVVPENLQSSPISRGRRASRGIHRVARVSSTARLVPEKARAVSAGSLCYPCARVISAGSRARARGNDAEAALLQLVRRDASSRFSLCLSRREDAVRIFAPLAAFRVVARLFGCSCWDEASFFAGGSLRGWRIRANSGVSRVIRYFLCVLFFFWLHVSRLSIGMNNVIWLWLFFEYKRWNLVHTLLVTTYKSQQKVTYVLIETDDN